MTDDNTGVFKYSENDPDYFALTEPDASVGYS